MAETSETNQTTKKTVPVQEGLFSMPDSAEGFHLIGSKCKSCGTSSFPKRKRCEKCFEDKVDIIPLNPRGKVVSWSIVRMKPFEYKSNVPYVLAIVELPENLQLYTQLKDINVDNPEIHIGDKVKVVPEIIGQDENGNDVLSFYFKRV